MLSHMTECLTSQSHAVAQRPSMSRFPILYMSRVSSGNSGIVGLRAHSRRALRGRSEDSERTELAKPDSRATRVARVSHGGTRGHVPSALYKHEVPRTRTLTLHMKGFPSDSKVTHTPSRTRSVNGRYGEVTAIHGRWQMTSGGSRDSYSFA
jgi:hypothetical protein